MKSTNDLSCVRWLVAMVIFGLVMSGASSFPLLAELKVLANILVGSGGSLDPADHTGFTHWVRRSEGLEGSDL
ncbi:MAG: hypothetical protein ACI8T1_001252 [Verrucomicrobiales bacterium]|jgi:hypothetical protein